MPIFAEEINVKLNNDSETVISKCEYTTRVFDRAQCTCDNCQLRENKNTESFKRCQQDAHLLGDNLKNRYAD